MGYALLKPIWDWDVIPYLFLAKQVLGATVVEAHGWIYAQVQALPEFWRNDLLTREDFRTVMAADPQALQRVMPFYQERVGYYGALAGLIGLGIPALWAVQGLGLVALALLGGVVWAWGKRIFPAWGALVLLAVVLAFPSVMKVVRWSNPDGLVAALYVLGVYAWLRGRLNLWTLAWLAMVLLRPNSAVLLLPLGFLQLWDREWNKATSLALIGLVAIEMHLLWPGFGLTVLWQYTFVGAVDHPETLRVPFDFSAYLGWLEARMLGLHGRDLLLFVAMWASLGIIGWKGNRRLQMFSVALVAGVLAQVLVFPGFWERLYVGPVLSLVLLATSCAVRGICGKAYKIGKQEK